MSKRRYLNDDYEVKTYTFPDVESERKFIEDHDVGSGPIEFHTMSSQKAKHLVNPNSEDSRYIPVHLLYIDRDECWTRGGEWVNSYQKKDGTEVSGYCRIFRR